MTPWPATTASGVIFAGGGAFACLAGPRAQANPAPNIRTAATGENRVMRTTSCQPYTRSQRIVPPPASALGPARGDSLPTTQPGRVQDQHDTGEPDRVQVAAGGVEEESVRRAADPEPTTAVDGDRLQPCARAD